MSRLSSTATTAQMLAWITWPILITLWLGVNIPAYAVNAYGQDTITNYQYDAGGNLGLIISPLDTASNPVRTDYHSDALDRLDTVTQPIPLAGQARPATLLYHDGQDQLTAVDDPRGMPTDYGVDGLGNQNTLASRDSGDSSNTYDEAGNLATHTDAQGKLFTYSYDALNRLTQISYTTGTPTVFSYDSYSGEIPSNTPNAIGRLTRMTDESGQTIYFYDDSGRRTMKYQAPIIANPQPGWNKGVNYTYGTTGNTLGKLASIVYPSGNQINYSYDTAGRIQSITLNPTNTNGSGTNTAVTTVLLNNIGYTPTGQFHSGDWGNNTAAVPSGLLHAYDLDGRMWAYYLGNPNQGGFLRYMQFDPAGRITQMNHNGNGTGVFAPANFLQSFGYDNLGRLISNTRVPGNQSYSYDASGNRLTTNTYTHTIDLSSNRLMNTSGPAPAKSNQYDLAGNLKTDGTVTYTYSDRGLLQTSTKAAVTTSYTYNGLGQRITKKGASVVQYVYDEQGHLIGEYDVYGNPIQETVYLGDIPIAVLTQTVGNTTTGSVLVDNNTTANITAVGSWPAATTIAGYQGTNYQTHAKTTTTTDSFSWKLNLPAGGKYWLQARWTADTTRASNATYSIAPSLGDVTTKTLSQKTGGNTWTNLALMDNFFPGTLTTVKLGTSSLGTVSADAVRALPAVVTTNVNYIFADHLNTPRVITRPLDNKIVWRWDQSDAFGVQPPNENPSALGTFTYNPRFPGQVYDAETGLFYNGHRYYDPKIGSYIQSDPIGLAGGINTYIYAYNNPLRWTDPSGLVVDFDGPDKAVQSLQNAYNKIKTTEKGRQLCETLENSPDTYLITNKFPYKIPGFKPDKTFYHEVSKTITVDPTYHPRVNTTEGSQPAPTESILGHEIGHAATGIEDDGLNRMNNVNANENPIRQELGLPSRTKY